MHRSEDRDAEVRVVVDAHARLVVVRAQEPAGVLDEAALEGDGKARKRVSSWGQSNPSPRYWPVAMTTSGCERRRPLDLVEECRPRTLAEAVLRGRTARRLGFGAPRQASAVLLPLAQHEAAPAPGERVEDVVADECVALLVLDEQTKQLLDRRLGIDERERGLADVEVAGDSPDGRSPVAIWWRIGPHCMATISWRPSRR